MRVILGSVYHAGQKGLMKKSTTIFLVGALGALILIPLIMLQLAPSGTAWLRGALFTVKDVPEQAIIARKLVDNGSADSLAALTTFAGPRRHVAFDARRRIMLLYDAADLRTHVVQPGRPLTVEHADPALAEAVQAAAPTSHAESFVTGDPPIAYLGVLLVESLPARTTFLMKVQADGTFQTVQFTFAGDRLVSSGFYDPDVEQVRTWRRTVTWPAGW